MNSSVSRLMMVALFSSVLASGSIGQSSGGGTGGGGGGSAGGSTGGSAGAGSAAGAGSTGAGTSGLTGRTSPQGVTGPQSRSPTALPSTVPRRDTGVRPLPNAGNAEPTSPIYRQDTDPNGRAPQRDATDPNERAPQRDSNTGGSGGRAGGGAGESDADNLDISKTHETNTISGEPQRVERQGGATGRTLDECMQNWDAGTHMTKDQWKTTCERLGTSR